MKSSTRTTLVALLCMAALSAAAEAAAGTSHVPPSVAELAPSGGATASPTSAEATLGEVIDDQLKRAHAAGRHDEIERLATLWMTLEQRGQLARQVSSPHGFIAASLRNQQRSAYRRAARAGRCVPVAEPTLDHLADARGLLWQSPATAGAPDQRLAAEELLDRIDEPLRTAVQLSATGLNRREVAEQLGVSHAAVRKWMERLRGRLATDGQPSG